MAHTHYHERHVPAQTNSVGNADQKIPAAGALREKRILPQVPLPARLESQGPVLVPKVPQAFHAPLAHLAWQYQDAAHEMVACPLVLDLADPGAAGHGALVTKYLTRNPKYEAAQEIVDLVHRLHTIKTNEEKEQWLMLQHIWEHQYEKAFNENNKLGGWKYKKLRSVRTIMRRSLPDLFTYLDYPGCPNTTNLVEGWVNTAIAEGLGRHRGLTLIKKKTLVSIVLSHLKRPMREKPTRKFP